jgi:hypothetical protein
VTDEGKPRLTVNRGLLSDLRADFLIRYRPHSDTGECSDSVFCRHPEAAVYDASYCNFATGGSTYWALVRDCFVRYSQSTLFEYSCQWIRDAATAELFAKLMIALLTRRPWIVQGVQSLQGLLYDLTERLRLSIAILPPTAPALSQYRVAKQQIAAIMDQDNPIFEVTSTFVDIGVP